MSERPEEHLEDQRVDETSSADDASQPNGSAQPGGSAQPQGAASEADSPVEEAAPEAAPEGVSWTADDSPGGGGAAVGDAAVGDAAEEGGATASEAAADEGGVDDDSSSEQPPPKPAAKKRSAKKSSTGRVQPLEEVPEEELEEVEDLERDWYILKVQSNREKSIRDALERRVKVAGLERFFGDIIVPTEDVAEYKNGKRKVTKRKLWPGYIVVNMAINEDTWFLVRETPGIGDFTGSIGRPTPMAAHEVERIIPREAVEDDDEQPIKTMIRFKPGDRVRVKDGYFQNFEGDVETIDEANGRVTVMISIFGRSTPVELEHWQIEDI